MKRDSYFDSTLPHDDTKEAQQGPPMEVQEAEERQQPGEPQHVRQGTSYHGCFFVYGLVLLVIVCILLIRNISSAFTRQRILSKIEHREQLITIHPTEVDLTGNYSIRLVGDTGNRGRYRTAIISCNGNDYDVRIVTDFGPEHHSFHIESDNKLVSKTLGKGEAEYKEELKLTKITFRNGGEIWEMIK